MGIRYGANYADTVDEKVVAEICPKEYEAFKKLLEKIGIDVEIFAKCLVVDCDLNDYADDGETDKISEKDQDTVHKAYEKLIYAFDAKTKNAGLSLGYHDADDDGDRYDDVNGAYWEVCNCYQLSPAGKFLKDKGLSRKFFVSFG